LASLFWKFFKEKMPAPQVVVEQAFITSTNSVEAAILKAFAGMAA
jgi:hypothetical protein